MHNFEESVKIHQCLHGYADGHQLIQTSTKLSPKADQLLLTLSDMSGPSMISGFQSYLTGYPVTDTSWYAFARTWYASEMPRPGCVWTHTLLIETADLARIQDFGVLLKLFIRPSKEKKQTSYTNPIKLELNSGYGLNKSSKVYDFDIASLIVSGLYQYPDKPVYLAAEGAEQCSDLVLEVWNQQYPKLRRAFMFCTGSLANRKAAGRNFDLQIIPTSALRQIQREVPHGIFIETQNAKLPANLPPWLTTATKDLLSSGNEVRQFLLLFGADAPEGRGSFSQLLTLYTHINKSKNGELPLSELLAEISEDFPLATQATRLKQALLGGATVNKPQFVANFTEVDLLRELAITNSYAAYDGGALKVQSRAEKLVHHEPEQAKKLITSLLDYEVNPLGEDIIKGIAEAITPSDALDLATQRYNLLFVFTKHNPSLFTMPQIWQVSRDRQRELYDLVRPRLENGEISIDVLIRAMLEAGSDVLSDEIVRQHRHVAVSIVLNWFDSSDESVLIEGWERALSYQTDAVIDWLSSAEAPRAATMALLAGMLDPHSRRVIRLGTHVWLHLSRISCNELDEPTYIRVMTFLLALGFNNPDNQAPELVAEAFHPVHKAAARDRLPYASWRLLMYQAPSLSWWGEWDKCERLRQALIDKFIRYGWNVEFFLRAVKDSDTFSRILYSCDEKGRGRNFIRRVAQGVAGGYIAATEEQRQTLMHYR